MFYKQIKIAALIKVRVGLYIDAEHVPGIVGQKPASLGWVLKCQNKIKTVQNHGL